jgi:hypothetical protein
MYPWRLWEWMRGEDPLPGRVADGEWQGSARVLWLDEAVRAAQRQLWDAWPRREHDPERYVSALQALANTVEAMEQSGLPATGLVAKEHAADIKRLGVTAHSPGARYQGPLWADLHQPTGQAVAPTEVRRPGAGRSG